MVKFNAFGVFHKRTAKNIESTADGQINPTPADLLHHVEVLQGTGSAGIGDRLLSPGTKEAHQAGVDALAAAFDIGRMDEEFGT